MDAKDPAFFSAFPDGRHFFMWQDRARTLAEIARFSRRDAEVYPAYEDQLERISQVVEGLLLTTPPQFPPRGLGRFPRLPEAGRRACAASAPKDLVALVKIFTQSAADFLDEWFESEEVKVTLATDGVIGANGGPRSPGTAYILLHHSHGRRGRPSRAVGLRARRHGRGVGSHGRLRARQRRRDPHQCRRWRRSWCAAGGLTAWCWTSGEEIEARAVASNLDPKVTFLQLVDERDLDPEFRAAIRRFRIEGTSCEDQPGAQRPAGVHRPAPARPARNTAPPCTSAPASTTWSAPGTTPSTAAPPSARCWN